MRKFITVVCLSLLIFPAFSQQQGYVLESLKMPSKILGHDVEYSIYLPAGYEQSTRKYPVLYLLHGYSDDETAWVQFGEIDRIANEMMSNGQASQAIIVMPDAGVSFYVNDYLGKVNYEDMFFNELIPFIEKTYRIRAKKEFRAIAGLSMGGYGALLYAMKHTDLFSACVPLSSAVLTKSEIYPRIKSNEKGLADIYGPLKGDSLPDCFNRNDILLLASTLPVEKLSSVKFYIDCGDKDFLIAGNCALHLALKERNIPHEFRVRDGIHNWVYWRASIVEGLKFISNSFKR